MRNGGGRKGRECGNSKKCSSHILKVKLRDSSVGFNAKDEKIKQTKLEVSQVFGPKRKKLKGVSTSTKVGKDLGSGEWGWDAVSYDTH